MKGGGRGGSVTSSPAQYPTRGKCHSEKWFIFRPETSRNTPRLSRSSKGNLDINRDWEHQSSRLFTLNTWTVCFALPANDTLHKSKVYKSPNTKPKYLGISYLADQIKCHEKSYPYQEMSSTWRSSFLCKFENTNDGKWILSSIKIPLFSQSWY